jgi:hypothetical protein
VSVIRIIPTSRHQILFREHLAFFHRGLVKRVDSQKMRGDDCLQHKMHYQSAPMPCDPTFSSRALSIDWTMFMPVLA